MEWNGDGTGDHCGCGGLRRDVHELGEGRGGGTGEGELGVGAEHAGFASGRLAVSWVGLVGGKSGVGMVLGLRW